MVVRAPRTGTSADGTGIQVRGLVRTRRLAWADVEDIRAEGVSSAGDRTVMPEVAVYAHLSGGRRVRLVHVNDLHLGSRVRVESEVAALREARAELCGAGKVSGSASA
ncbi:PH domain-containing protein [Kitasatospora sp. NPDC004240]